MSLIKGCQRISDKVFAQHVEPHRHQRGDIVDGEFWVALHTQDITTNMIHRIGTEIILTDQRGPCGQRFNLILMDVNKLI